MVHNRDSSDCILLGHQGRVHVEFALSIHCQQETIVVMLFDFQPVYD
jgi:hypothetical protein